jgi:hypothetical protein
VRACGEHGVAALAGAAGAACGAQEAGLLGLWAVAAAVGLLWRSWLLVPCLLLKLTLAEADASCVLGFTMMSLASRQV